MNKLITDILTEGDITGMAEDGAIPIKGTIEKDNVEYVYFQDNEDKRFDDQTNEIFTLMAENRDYVSDGTMMAANIVIILPGNILLHGISFSGPDPKNWLRGFEKGAQKAGILGGHIEGPKIPYKEFVDDLSLGTEDYVNLISYKRTGKDFDLILTNGTRYKLSDCEIYTPYGDAEVFDNKIDGIREILRGRSKEKPVGKSKL